MSNRTRLAAVASVSLLVALGGCSGGGGGSSSAPAKDAGGPPPCSDFANGAKITEDLTTAGCTGNGVSANASTVCGGGHRAVAVGPVYGFVGKQAHYLGDGKDATKSPEWKKFQQDCPWQSE